MYLIAAAIARLHSLGDILRGLGELLLLTPIACSLIIGALGQRLRSFVERDPEWRIYARPGTRLRPMVVDTAHPACPGPTREEYERIQPLISFLGWVVMGDVVLIVVASQVMWHFGLWFVR